MLPVNFKSEYRSYHAPTESTGNGTSTYLIKQPVIPITGYFQHHGSFLRGNLRFRVHFEIILTC